MSIRKGLPQYLAGQAAITALVANRIYPVARPQGGALPAIVFARSSGQHGHQISGSSGHAAPVFNLDCLAGSYQQVDELAEAVRSVMQGLGSATTTLGNVAVKSVILEDDADDFDAPEDGSDRPAFVIRLRYRILHSETAPAL